MNKTTNTVDWNYAGKPDFLFGTGATRMEKGLVLSSSALGILLYAFFYFSHHLEWSWWQYIIAILIAMDVLGGLVANSLNSCKRFYHTPTKPEEPWYTPWLKNHLLFAILHVYPILVSVIFGKGNYFYGIFWYTWLVFAAFLIIKTPLYLQRPVAFLIITISLLLNFYFIPSVQGFEWLIPALYLKILYGYLVQEEPYRPVGENET